MTTDNHLWLPDKPVELFDDDEIKGTPIFQSLKASGLPDETLISIAQKTIREMWEQKQLTMNSDVILAVFDRVRENGEEDEGKLIIKEVFDEKGQRYGVVEQPKTKGGKRFTPKDYSRFLGQGTPKDSPDYKEAVEALKEHCGKDESALHGGFVMVKNTPRNPDRNCVLELVIKAGYPGNEKTDLFVAELHQHPFEEQSVPVIKYPPVSGKTDEGDLVQTDEIREVTSMSQMLRQSVADNAITPAVAFGLAAKLKQMRAAGNLPPLAKPAGAGASEAPKAAEPKPEAKKSAAMAMLDDDED